MGLRKKVLFSNPQRCGVAFVKQHLVFDVMMAAAVALTVYFGLAAWISTSDNSSEMMAGPRYDQLPCNRPGKLC